MRMFKLHKKNSKDNLLYVECWTNNDKTGFVHTRKVGKDGNTEEFIIGKAFKTNIEFLKHFEAHFRKLDYSDFDESNLTWLVVQFEIKSLKGSK